MVTMKDIAAAAGVSRGTVDRVLNNRGRVAKDKEKRIRKIAKELGYQPNPAGKGLAVKKKQLKLGFIYLTGHHVPFHNIVYSAAERYAAELEQYGVEVRFFPITTHIETDEEWTEVLKRIITGAEQINGWAVLGIMADPLVRLLKAMEIDFVPVVSYNIDSACDWKIAHVGCDYQQAGRLACGVASLMTDASGKVCILSVDNGDIQSSVERIKGFRDEMMNCCPKMEIVDTMFLGMVREFGPSEEARIRSLEKRDDIDIIYLVNPGDYSICERISMTDMHHKAKFITNDLVTREQWEMVRSGRIAVTICQEPEVQGRKPLEILFNYLALGREPEHIWQKTELTIKIAQNLG